MTRKTRPGYSLRYSDAVNRVWLEQAAQGLATEPPRTNLHPLALAVHLALREWRLHRGH